MATLASSSESLPQAHASLQASEFDHQCRAFELQHAMIEEERYQVSVKLEQLKTISTLSSLIGGVSRIETNTPFSIQIFFCFSQFQDLVHIKLSQLTTRLIFCVLRQQTQKVIFFARLFCFELRYHQVSAPRISHKSRFLQMAASTLLCCAHLV
jgi:hypothetical protein